MLFLGKLSGQLMHAMVLGLCLRAFGAHAHFSQLILINTLVALFAGLMPVPGGVGVAEAGLTAGLVAIGIPSSVGDLDGARLPPGDVLPAAPVGLGRDALAKQHSTLTDRSISTSRAGRRSCLPYRRRGPRSLRRWGA